MSLEYITIESVSGEAANRVKQRLKFRTGKFIWKIKFTAPLNPATINNKNLYVTSLDLNPLATHIRYDSEKQMIEIEPIDAYAKDESYLLHVTTNVASLKGQKLPKEITIQFKV